MITLDDCINKKNLIRAWEKVCRKNSISGLDEVSVKEYSEKLESNLDSLAFDIIHDLYKPSPVHILSADKNIAILCVKDKILHTAISIILSDEIEQYVVDNNYSYLKGRSTFQAVDYIHTIIKMKDIYKFYQCDIANFFNSIDHQILLNKINCFISDEKLLNLLKNIMQTTVLKNDKLHEVNCGVLLGSPLSPVFSNIYMLDFDKIMDKSFPLYVRYSDDIIVGFDVESEDDKINFLKKELSSLKLTINETKSGFRNLEEGFNYLGHTIIGKRPECKKKVQTNKTDNFKTNTSKESTGTESLNILFEDIQHKRFEKILDYVFNITSLQEHGLDLKELAKTTVETGDLRIAIIIHMFLIRNDLKVPDKICEYVGKIFGEKIRDFEKICVEYEKQGFVEELVNLLISCGQYDIAEQMNAQLLTEEPNPERNDFMGYNFKKKFVTLFKGKDGCYARGYTDGNGNRYYYKVDMNFTEIELERMINERHSIGIYPLDENNRTKLLVIDIDIDKKILIEHGDEGSIYENLLDKAKHFSLEIYLGLKAIGINVYLEFSGYKGYHLWIFFNDYIQIEEIYSDIYAYVERFNCPSGIHWEILPSMRHEDEEVVKVPLSFHEYSLKQAVFLDDDGHVIKEQYFFIEKIKENDPNRFIGKLDGNTLNSNIGNGILVKKNKLDEYPEYILNIYNKCKLIRQIVNRSLEQNYLNHFERNALLYVFGHAGEEGKKFLHFVISNCINYNYEVTEGFISRLKENPVSCNKLNLRFNQECEQLECEENFEEYPLFYPSPVIFGYELNPDSVTKPEIGNKVERIAEISRINEELRINTLAVQLLELSKKKKKIEKELKRCCEELNSVFDGKGISEYEVDVGLLIKKDGEWYLKVL